MIGHRVDPTIAAIFDAYWYSRHAPKLAEEKTRYATICHPILPSNRIHIRCFTVAGICATIPT